MPVGPSAIATWANLVTVGRMFISPVMFILIPDDGMGSWIALAAWFLLCVSDGIDGYLARRHGSTWCRSVGVGSPGTVSSGASGSTAARHGRRRRRGRERR